MAKQGPQDSHHHFSRWLLAYASTYTAFHLLPAFLSHEIQNRLTSGDILNLFTPFVLLPIVWKLSALLRATVPEDDKSVVARAQVVLLFSATLYANGHGMNLAANAIGRHLTGMEGTPIFWLDYFFDEQLGHIIWHGGVTGLAFGLLMLATNLPPAPHLGMVLVAAPLFAFTYFADGVEGQTAWLNWPAALLLCAWSFFRMKKESGVPGANPVALFYAVAGALAVLLFVIWWVWHGGLPQFSALGWI